MSPLGRWTLSGTELAVLPVALAALVLQCRTHSAPHPGPSDTIILQDDFESGSLSQWAQIPDTGRYSLSTDPRRVHSGTHSQQALYTPANGYGIITRWFMPGYDEVYVRFFVMFEDGFQNLRGDSNGMHFFALAGNRIDSARSSFGKPGVVPNGTDFFYAGLDPEHVQRDPTLRPFSFYTYWPDMPGHYGSVMTQDSLKVPLLAGRWQEVVFHLRLNSLGEADGAQAVWINGVKVLDHPRMRWRTTSDLRINEIRFDNYMPGGLRTQHLWIDDVTVWTPRDAARAAAPPAPDVTSWR